MDEPDPNDPADLQPMVDFVFWMTVATKLQAKGVVSKVPFVTGKKAKVQELMQQAVTRGVAPKKDKATIRRVIREVARYSGMDSPPRRRVEELIVVMQHYQEFVDV